MCVKLSNTCWFCLVLSSILWVILSTWMIQLKQSQIVGLDLVSGNAERRHSNTTNICSAGERMRRWDTVQSAECLWLIFLGLIFCQPWTFQLPLDLLRDGFRRKRIHSFGHCPNEGGGGPCPNKRSLLLPLILSLNCTLGCIYIVYYIVDWTGLTVGYKEYF